MTLPKDKDSHLNDASLFRMRCALKSTLEALDVMLSSCPTVRSAVRHHDSAD